MAKSLKLTINLGKADAQRLGIAKPQEGQVVSVKDDAAEELLSKGWAVEPGKAGGPAAVAAAVEEDEGDDAAPESFDVMTKEDLKAYADHHKIGGVSAAMTKDDIIRTIKRHHPAPK